ncbi:MAG TPA: AAA family ATPase [Streptosporangiaceae bacterium]|nr:AAA family ATPase [Streptosporangiaceae bacterium]
MRRISVVGNSGSGKTTLARAVAAELGVPHLELDSIFHQPDWQPLDRAVFEQRVDEFTQAPGWVVDGNYSAVRALVWSRADTVIWLDLPRRRVMRQLIWRTLRRMATRAELWNGNREQWRNLLGPPEESIILWAWTKHRAYRDRYLTAQADPANAHLTFVRVRNGKQMADLLRSCLATECVDRGDLGVAEIEPE